MCCVPAVRSASHPSGSSSARSGPAGGSRRVARLSCHGPIDATQRTERGVRESNECTHRRTAGRDGRTEQRTRFNETDRARPNCVRVCSSAVGGRVRPSVSRARTHALRSSLRKMSGIPYFVDPGFDGQAYKVDHQNLAQADLVSL